jgi:hypothetical protein
MHASSDEIDVSLVVLPLACHLRMFRTMRGRWDTTGLAASRAAERREQTDFSLSGCAAIRRNRGGRDSSSELEKSMHRSHISSVRVWSIPLQQSSWKKSTMESRAFD